MTKTKLTLEEQYQRASKAQKRVLIAKDAIKQIALRRYIPKHMTYFKIEKSGKEDTLGAGLCDGLVCRVCAKGAVFASKVRCDAQEPARSDAMTGRNNHECVEPVLGTFTERQLDKIEAYFEGFNQYGLGQAELWRKRYGSAEARLLAILRNIIRNKGTFKP